MKLPQLCSLISLLLLASLWGCGRAPRIGVGDDDDNDDDSGGPLDGDQDGYLDSVDCDDTDPAVHPGAEEICNLRDDDCDGLIDEDVPGSGTYFLDADGDAYGVEPGIPSCAPLDGYAPYAGDCDDGDASVHPGAGEACDGRDTDCDGVLPPDELDADGDGYLACDDCDDTAAAVFPGAVERCDGVDNDCDWAIDEEGLYYPDQDGDGFGDEDGTPMVGSCIDPPPGAVLDATDCDDGDPLSNPLGQEICDEADADEDCDRLADDEDDSTDPASWSTVYPDADGDGYGGDAGAVSGCDNAPPGSLASAGDCDDGDAAVHPGQTEICDDGVDNNCDGSPNGCGLVGVLSLGDADVRLIGETHDNMAGSAMDGAGDINGDGVPDLIVGAKGNSATGTYAGAAYVVFGPAPTSLSLSSAPIKLVGELSTDYAGSAVAGAGDVDGDGFDDLVVGASQNSQGANWGGAAYIVRGPLSADRPLSSADAKLLGASAYANLGNAVAGVGDVNADGFDDVLVGANYDDEGGGDAGAAYLLYGPISGTISASSVTTRLIGESGGDKAGTSLAAAGDMNGDGFDDILVGAPGNGGVGAAYLLYGPLSGVIDLGAADVKFVGDVAPCGAGSGVAAAGDVNGDGEQDVLIGAWQDGEGAYMGGAAYIALGPFAPTVQLSASAAKLLGEEEDDYAGYAVAGPGDVNGDGLGDVLVGAYQANRGGGNSGVSYLFYGPISGTLDLGAADLILVGEAAGDWSGRSLGAPGDLNNDGYDDLMVGGFWNDTGGGNAGVAYLFYGSAGM